MPVPPVIQMYRYVMGSGGGLGNLLKASEEFQQTDDWVRYPTSSQTPTVNADSRPDPNGGTTADQVDYTANTGARLMQTVTLKASTEYTFSVHARAVSGTVDFRMRNITLKAAVQKTATTTGPLTNGFTRFTYTFTTGAAGSYELALQNASGTPTARSVIFWGAMLNEGGTAADYEYAAPTTGGSAPAPAYAGFGDAFGGVTAYYSLRQFTEAETLNAIRVRRSSDDTEQDIGFDANGDLDTTALLAFVNEDVDVYTSDFSSTEDLFETNGTGAAAQSVGGVDDAYKFTTITGTAQMFANPIASPFSGKGGGNSFRVQADVYLPSTNSEIDLVKIWTGYGEETFANVTATDTWTSIDQTVTISSGSTLRFQAYNGSDITPTTTGANVFYLKNIVVTQTTADGAVTTFYDQSGNGNNATNATASEQPLIVSSGSTILDGTKPAIDFASTQYLRTIGNGGDYTQPNTYFIAGSSTNSGSDFVDAVDQSKRNLIDYGGGVLRMYAGSVFSSTFPFISGQRELKYALFNGTNSEISVNGATIQTGNPSTMAMDSAFDISDTASVIKMQELIIFNSDQSANLGTVTTGGGTLIQGNINTHFNMV